MMRLRSDGDAARYEPLTVDLTSGRPVLAWPRLGQTVLEPRHDLGQRVFDEPALTAERGFARRRLAPRVAPVGAQLAGVRGVRELGCQQAIADLLPQLTVDHREDDLHAVIEIARHQIGTAEIDLRLPAGP